MILKLRNDFAFLVGNLLEFPRIENGPGTALIGQIVKSCQPENSRS